MATVQLLAPQMVINSRMLYYTWVPEDPDAVAALVPPGLEPAGVAFINQYVVDKPEQTSGFGAYSLTYAGSDLKGLDLADGTPGRWWTHYFNSSPSMIAYASERGVPASEGSTTLEIQGDTLIATTFVAGKPIIRSTVKIGQPRGVIARGQLRYITNIKGQLTSGRYPYIAELVDPFQVVSLEFLDPSHSIYALRPKQPLQVVFGFYSPAASFCYPGGEEPI